MDLVLEFCDAYAFDYLYSTILPASLSAKIPPSWQKSLSLGNSSLVDFMPNDYSQGLAEKLSVTNVATNFGEKSDVYGHFPVWFSTSIYTNSSLLPRSNIVREFISLFIIITLFGWLFYFIVASFSYVFIFDKAIFNHPRYLKNQMSLEIRQAVASIPMMVIFTSPWFLSELRGYSKLYWDVHSVSGGWWSIFLQFPAFIMFTDFGIYLIHRWLHWPNIYKIFHKPHHKWLVTTPYASHSFHPADGYFQSLPYHIYPFLFPLHKLSYLILFTFVNFWTVMIHDGEYLANDPYINGAACHTVHHLYFNYNYGQFTTLWDRIGNSYREPDRELFDKSKKQSAKTWNEQIRKMEAIKEVVEGPDERVYKTEGDLKL